MKKSINQIRLELKAVADAHRQINDYAWKDFLRAYEENDLNYPLMCAYYPSGNIYMNQTQIQLNIVICDRIEKDWNKNLNEVESDTLQICRDVFNVLNESSRWQRIGRVSNCVVNKFINRGGDEVAGHTMQIDFLLRDNSGVCDLPMDGYDFDQAISQGCPSVDIFNSDLSYTAEVASGDSLELPDITYDVKNSLGTTLAGATVPSVSNIETTLSDVNNIDSDGSTVPTPAGVAFTCTPSSPPSETQTTKTGQTVSYTDYDDGFEQFGREVDFFTLSENNPFGNTLRFTGTTGTGTIQADTIMLDWAHRTSNGVYGWSTTVYDGVDFLTDIANAHALTVGGLSNWFLPNKNQIQTLENSGTLNAVNWSPLNCTAGLLRTCTTDPNNSGNNFVLYPSSHSSQMENKLFGFPRRYIVFRIITLAELGL